MGFRRLIAGATAMLIAAGPVLAQAPPSPDTPRPRLLTPAARPDSLWPPDSLRARRDSSRRDTLRMRDSTRRDSTWRDSTSKPRPSPRPKRVPKPARHPRSSELRGGTSSANSA